MGGLFVGSWMWCGLVRVDCVMFNNEEVKE